MHMPFNSFNQTLISGCEEARRFRNFRAQIKPTDNQAAEDELKKEIRFGYRAKLHLRFYQPDI